jgi:hypothetical protein
MLMKNLKKIPLRTCIGCKEKKQKKELIRIIRNSDGRIEIDITGKKSGRGAYVCYNIECFEKALKRGRLQNALKTEITENTIIELQKSFNNCID